MHVKIALFLGLAPLVFLGLACAAVATQEPVAQESTSSVVPTKPHVFLRGVEGYGSVASLVNAPHIMNVGSIEVAASVKEKIAVLVDAAVRQAAAEGCDALIDNTVFAIPPDVPRSITPRGVRLSQEMRRAGPVAAWEFTCGRFVTPVETLTPAETTLVKATDDDPVARLVTGTCRAAEPIGSRIARTACFCNSTGRMVTRASPDYAHEVIEGPSEIRTCYFRYRQIGMCD
jgi:hypothetical protein